MRSLLLASMVLVFGVRGLAGEAVYLDEAGVIRWRVDDREVALFGANYTLPSASDYRAAGYVGSDRKKLIERDMAHFARLGWDGMRLALWGDWENSDREGNLIANEHLDLMDYLLWQAKQRGISMLFTPIHTHSALWPEGKDGDHVQGFSKHFPRDQMGRDPAAIAAQVNYLRQILEHVNPYTGVALKDEPAIVFIELINEPWHHADDFEGSVAYINALADAVRSTGCGKILVHNLSQDFDMAGPIRASRAQGVAFGWYPTALVARRTLADNFLRWVDDYPPMDDPQIAGMPRIVYEFDAADTLTPTMYPAMVRTFRGVGAQFAAMFAYDMLDTAPYNLGWQTHYLNLVYTPRKAVGAIIAAEAMRRLPRGERYGQYPGNRRFGPFGVSPEAEGVAWMETAEAFMHAGDRLGRPADLGSLRRIVAFGSSDIVDYEGEGAYFLDRIDDGVWRLEVYPDAVLVQDPFAQRLNHETVSSRLVWRMWPMRVRLPDLGETFSVEPANAGNTHRAIAAGGRFLVQPGVYVLTRDGRERAAALPERLGQVGFSEFVCPPAPDLPVQVVPRVGAERVARDATGLPWEADVVATDEPRKVMLHTRPEGDAGWRTRPMHRTRGYRYRADVDDAPGSLAWYVTVETDTGSVRAPAEGVWTVRLVAREAPIALLEPAADFSRLFHARREARGEAGPISLVPAEATVPARLRFTGPAARMRIGWSVHERIAARDDTILGAQTLRLTASVAGEAAAVTLVLVESDGTSWSRHLVLESGRAEVRLALGQFALGGGSKVPVGYPGSWNVDLPPAAGRGGAGDRVKVEDIQQVQLVFDGSAADTTIDLEAIELRFE